jgi:hypothetical protein
MANQPDTLAFWTLAFMEYPYKTRGYNARVFSDDGTQNVAPETINNGAANVYIAGPRQRVLYVMTNAFVRTGGTLPIRVGSILGANVVLDINNNSINGVSVDLVPALDAVFNSAYSSNTMMSHLTTAMQWWHGHFGNRGDFTAALLAAASASQWIPPMPLRDSNTPDYIGLANNGGVPSYPGKPMHVDDLICWAASSSNPDCLFNPMGQASSLTQLRENLSVMPVRHIGALDYIAACDAVWGVLEFIDKDYNMPCSALHATSRLRSIGQTVTVIHDIMYMNSGYSLAQLTQPALLDAVSAGGARVRTIHERIGKSLASFLKPDSWPDKHPFTFGLYPNSLAQTNPWTIWACYNKDVQSMVGYARVPMSFLPGAGFDAFTMPDSYLIKKFDNISATIKRLQDSTLIEFTDYKMLKYNAGQNTETWKDLVSTQVIVPPLGNNRVVLNMFLSAPLDDIRIPFSLPVVTPGYSDGFAFTFSRVGVVRTPISPTGFDRVDPVVFPTLPCVNVATNQIYRLSIGQGQFQKSITWQNLMYQAKRIHHITQGTWATSLIGDSGLDEAPDMAGVLDF